MAEAAGLALGVVGVAGLYSVVLQVVEQISNAASFNTDFATQKTTFNTVKTSLRAWGLGTGLAASGTLLPDHSSILDDQEVLYDVQCALACINDACAELQACLDKSEPPKQTNGGTGSRARVVKKIASAGRRLRWTFQEKTKVQDLIDHIICLAGLLFKIARPGDPVALLCDAKLAELLSSNEGLSTQVAEVLIEQAKEQQRGKQRDLERWLNAPDTRQSYHAALAKALPGTCRWITDDALVQRWMDDTQVPSQDTIRCLWIYSRTPGAGKTVAASKLVESIQCRHGCSLAYYFCSHESGAGHGYDEILRSWILQLARHAGWAAIETAHDSSVEHDRPVDLWGLLRSLLAGPTPAYLVLDGLDELEGQTSRYTTGTRSHFLTNILTSIRHTTARLLVLSRYEKDIDRVLTANNEGGNGLAVAKSEIELRQTAPDTQLVAQREISLRFPSWSTEDQTRAVQSLVKRSDGMFVLLHAILEQLQDGMTYYEAIGIVSQPLTGQSNTDMLQQAYQGQVQNILRLPPSVRDFCLTVLLWVQNSSRPLRFCELLDVLSLLHRKRPNASSDVPRLRTLHDVEFHLLRHCTILLSLQNDTADFRQSILHLAHFSVKEFLQTTGCFETSRFHNWRLFQGGQLAGAYMAKACLEYLLQPKFSRYPAETTSSNSQGIYEYKETFGESLRNDCPFYDYAATFWARHLDMSCSSPSLVAFLDPNNESSASNRTTFADPQSQSALDTLTWVEQYLEVVSPRDEAAYQKFLPTDPELSALCLDFLGVATTIGGTSCNYRIWRHYHLGVFNGESDGGYLPNARDSLTHLTSIWSRPDGHPLWRILDFMLPSRLLYLYGTSYRSLALQSRLLEALCLQSTGLTAFLVTQGADINFTWPDNHTTMELYIRRTTGTRSPMFFYTLLTHFCAKTLSNKPIHAVHIPVGREVFRAGGGGWINPRLLWGFLYGNALQRKVLKASHFEREEWDASGSTDLEVIRTMIAWYIEVNNRSLFFPSAVHAAVLNDQAGREQLEMLDLIFENEGDANAGPWLRPIGTFLGIDEGDLTLRESLCEMFLQLLPSSGISHGRTFGSLLRLIEHNPHFSYRVDEIISKVLSEKALRYNSAGWIKSEQLSLAVRRGDKEAVESMLAKGINVNRCGTWYGSALYVAAYTGNKDLVQLLLRHNADPNIAVESRILPLELERDFGWAGLWRRSLSREDASYTPLQAAASRDHTEIVQTLLQHGADVNHNAQQSGTALYFAMCNARPHYQATEWSQERRGGDNLPYWRALNGRDRINSRKLIDLLLEHGADVNLCGGRYCTPLQVACVIGEVDLITVLLRKGADPNLVGGEEGTALQAALTNFPDPDPEAVKKGQTLDEQLHAPLIPPSFYLYSPILARCAPLMHEGWNVEALAAGQPPDNRALAISQLLLDHGADPTLQAGPWGTAIHAAAYFSSVEVLALILDSRYSDPTARRTAANTHSQAMGVALNGPAVTARYDKVTLLLQHASAEFYWHSLLKMRLRRVGSNAFMRVKLLLAVAWAVRDFLVFIAVVAGATSVAWPIYTLWNELDAKCWEWDPRLGGLWMLFSILAAGWVTNVRDSWANDTAW